MPCQRQRSMCAGGIRARRLAEAIQLLACLLRTQAASRISRMLFAGNGPLANGMQSFGARQRRMLKFMGRSHIGANRSRAQVAKMLPLHSSNSWPVFRFILNQRQAAKRRPVIRLLHKPKRATCE